MNIQDFFIEWNGKQNDIGTYKGECVNVVKSYFQEVLGLPPFMGNAIDYFNTPPTGFTKIKKSLLAYPQPGDIIIFNYASFGHVAIANWVRTFDLNCFGQNDPIGSPCHFKDYSYKSILGWLRPDPAKQKVPLKIAMVGEILPVAGSLAPEVNKYSSGKISINVAQYNEAITTHVTQDQAYRLVDYLQPKEKFIFIFYPPSTDAVMAYTFYYPKRDCCITLSPSTDARLCTFELAHSLQIFYNVHRGSNPSVEVVDNFYPTDELIKSKYDSVSWFYQ
jgi:hypothetical protein